MYPRNRDTYHPGLTRKQRCETLVPSSPQTSLFFLSILLLSFFFIIPDLVHDTLLPFSSQTDQVLRGKPINRV